MKTKFDEKDQAVIMHVISNNIKENLIKIFNFFEEIIDEIDGEDNKRQCFGKLILSYSASILGSITSRFLSMGEIVGVSNKKFVEEFLNHILIAVKDTFTEERFKELNEVRLALKSQIN